MGNKTEAEKRQLHDLHMGNIKHNHCNTKIYRVWCTMWQRCTNPKAHLYSNYGGRGISVCERWNNFEAFLEDMGERPTNKHTIDRINNDRNRSNTKYITYQGRTQVLADWAKEVSLSACIINMRLRHGWSIEKTFNTPARATFHYLTFNNKTLTVSDWAKQTKLAYNTILNRLLRNWPIEKTLTTPARKICHSH